MLAYRITHKNYAETLTASGIDGRWTSGGRKVVYCAESIALAFLENMIRRQGLGFNKDFKTVIIDVPDSVVSENIVADDLAKGWRKGSNYEICRVYGNRWYDKGATVALKVPSAVLPSAVNFILNTIHKDFKMIKIVGIADLLPDERIEDILKGHKK